MRVGGLTIATCLLAGCSGSSLLLLPDEEGGQGRVAVLDEQTLETRAEIAEGNSRSRLGRNRAATRQVDPARFRRGERDVLGRIPPKPVFFDINFETDSAALGPAEQQQVAKIIALSRRPGVEVEIIGHADAAGAADYNLALSEQRANAVRSALLASGVPAEAITSVEGQGEEELVVVTADGVRDARNRRVEVTVR